LSARRARSLTWTTCSRTTSPGKVALRRSKSSRPKSSTTFFIDFLRKLKQDLAGGDTLTVISEQTGRVTHAEKNLNKLENNRAKDLERALKDLEDTREELAATKTKYKAAVARRDTLENQMKDYKAEVASKMRILIDKTGNKLPFNHS